MRLYECKLIATASTPLPNYTPIFALTRRGTRGPSHPSSFPFRPPSCLDRQSAFQVCFPCFRAGPVHNTSYQVQVLGNVHRSISQDTEITYWASSVGHILLACKTTARRTSICLLPSRREAHYHARITVTSDNSKYHGRFFSFALVDCARGFSCTAIRRRLGQ